MSGWRVPSTGRPPQNARGERKELKNFSCLPATHEAFFLRSRDDLRFSACTRACSSSRSRFLKYSGKMRFPSSLMFTVALTSLSRCVPHCVQVHSRSFRARSSFLYPKQWQSFELAKNLGTFTRHVPFSRSFFKFGREATTSAGGW